jgi:dipeptidyl aminopeptidase/acylaminoacyl peptidase
LYPLGADKFFVGAGLASPAPIEARISFQRDPGGAVVTLLWQPEGTATRTARRVDLYREELVSFKNGAVRLHGMLVAPVRTGPYPAIVLLHGSGAQDRNALLPFALFLVRHGIALLAYDKRGVGESTGDWERSSFQDLADDATAAVHFLQQDPKIISNKIGVLGVSQGGWIGPLAASRSKEVAFVVSVSGPGVTPANETIGFIQNEMATDRFSEKEISQAVNLTQAAFHYARTGADWETYLAERSKALNSEWFPYMGLSDRKDDPLWEFRRLNNDYDPLPVLARVQCPVLAFFGGHDLNVTAVKNRPIWEEALEWGRNRDHTLEVIADGNHVLINAQSGSMAEFPNLKTFDHGYFRILLRWLADRLPGVQE